MKRILSVIAVAILLLIAIFYNDLKQPFILRKEVNKIYKLDWNTETIDMTIKSTGQSGKIEKIIKEYYNELYGYRKEYDSVKLYDLCSDALSVNQLKNSDLNEIKENINALYAKRTEASNKIIEVIDNQYILSLIKNTQLKKYYVWLYKVYTMSDDNDMIKKWADEVEKNNLIYELTVSALDVLINNKNVWHIEKDNLYFSDENVLKEYNEIVGKLNNLKESDVISAQ